MYKKIVVPLDGSDNAACAIDVAFGLAAGGKGTIVFCSVVDALEIAKSFLPGAKALGPWIAEVRREASRTLAAAVGAAHVRGIDSTVTLLYAGPTADAIVSYANEIEADAIVMGTHGRTGFLRRILGSVAHEVLSNATCAVITVRPTRKRAAVTGEIHASGETNRRAV